MKTSCYVLFWKHSCPLFHVQADDHLELTFVCFVYCEAGTKDDFPPDGNKTGLAPFLEKTTFLPIQQAEYRPPPPADVHVPS